MADRAVPKPSAVPLLSRLAANPRPAGPTVNVTQRELFLACGADAESPRFCRHDASFCRSALQNRPRIGAKPPLPLQETRPASDVLRRDADHRKKALEPLFFCIITPRAHVQTFEPLTLFMHRLHVYWVNSRGVIYPTPLTTVVVTGTGDF